MSTSRKRPCKYPTDVQEDDKIVGRILTRREAIRMFSVAGATTLVGGAGAASAFPTPGPRIEAQPGSQSVIAGADVVMSVVAGGQGLAYQWYKGSAPVTGATSPSHTIRRATEEDAGTYHVVVTGPEGSTASETANLQVTQVALVATPELEEGPFFVDEKLHRRDLTADTKRKSVVDGVPFTLKFKLYSLVKGSPKPLKGAHIDVWHCDTIGAYGDEASGFIQDEDTRGQKWLRGYQVTDGEGAVTFKTIYPGWYRSRTIHFHVKIRTYDEKKNLTHEFITQVFCDDKITDHVQSFEPYRKGRPVLNKDDGIYAARQADGTMVGKALMLNLSGSRDKGYTGTFSLAFAM